MGRGLSDLQRFILRRAGEQHRLYYAEIYVAYFGWPPTQPLRRHDGTDPQLVAGSLADPGTLRFDPDTIGRERYHSTAVVVSRACSRLEERGLVTCLQATLSHWSGVAITDAGRAWLSADSAVRRRSRQPIAPGQHRDGGSP
jgi:hypothetical protein